MRWIGLVVALLGVWLLTAWWGDPVEGKIARPIAVLMTVGGIVGYLEGCKGEIIDAIRQKNGSDQRD